jgi:hypothetical protein
MTWNDDRLQATFVTVLPPPVRSGTRWVTVDVYLDHLKVGVLHWSLEVGDTMGPLVPADHDEALAREVFVSFDRRDRGRIWSRLDRFCALVPSMSVHRRCIECRQMPDWRRTMRRVIRRVDGFYLLYSHRADQSPEVEAEWRMGLTRGAGFISGIQLHDAVAVPPELGEVRFRRWT